MTATTGEVSHEHRMQALSARDIVGDPVPTDPDDPAMNDQDPEYEGTVDLDVEKAIMQRVSRICLSGACAVRQWQLAHDLATVAAPGGRITPGYAASLLLQRMDCPMLGEEPPARLRLTAEL